MEYYYNGNLFLIVIDEIGCLGLACNSWFTDLNSKPPERHAPPITRNLGNVFEADAV